MLEHFFNHQFVYVFLLILVIFAISSVFVKNKLLKKFCILFFAVFYSLFFMELLLSFFMQEPITTLNIGYLNNIKDNSCHKCRDAKYIDKNNMTLRFSGEIFNDIKFTQSEHCTLVHDVTYTEYSNGFRYTKCNKSSEDTYIFLGCSFVFGDGVKDEETLPYYFSYLFDFKKNVLNFGESGKGINMAMSILNTGLIENKKYNHFFYSLMSDHFNRAFRYDSFVKCYDGYLYKNNQWIIPTIIGKIKYIFSKSYIFRKVFVTIINKYNKQYYENYIIEGLRELKKTIKEKYNSKLTIIVWPDFYPYCTSDDFFENLRKTDLDLIFLPEYFNSEEDGYKIKYDIHPTGKANKEIAQILYNHINNIDNNNKEI